MIIDKKTQRKNRAPTTLRKLHRGCRWRCGPSEVLTVRVDLAERLQPVAHAVGALLLEEDGDGVGPQGGPEGTGRGLAHVVPHHQDASQTRYGLVVVEQLEQHVGAVVGLHDDGEAILWCPPLASPGTAGIPWAGGSLVLCHGEQRGKPRPHQEHQEQCRQEVRPANTQRPAATTREPTEGKS